MLHRKLILLGFLIFILFLMYLFYHIFINTKNLYKCILLFLILILNTITIKLYPQKLHKLNQASITPNWTINCMVNSFGNSRLSIRSPLRSTFIKNKLKYYKT